MNAIRSLILILTLFTPVLAQGKPILLIFKSDRCPPCRQFDQTMMTDKNFCNTLQSSFDLRVLNIDTEEGRATSNSHGILQIPAFIVFVNNKPVIKPIYGFSPTRSGKALFLSQLSIVSQPREVVPQQQEIVEEQQLPLPESIIEIPQDNVRNVIEESTNKTNDRIRDALSELRTDLNRSLSQSEEKIKQATTLNKVKFNEIDNKVSDLIESQNSIELKINKVTDTVSDLSKTVTNINKTVTNINTSQTSFEEVLVNSQQTPQTVPQQEKPQATGLVGTLVKFGVGAAATAFGWPIAGTALGTAAIGLGIGFIRNRLKKNKQHTHPVTKPIDQTTQQSTTYTPYSHQTTNIQPQPVQQYPPSNNTQQTVSETRFVTKEVDIVGESYKEAIRKVANTLGDTNPAYKDVAAMIDHTAREIERGKRKPKDKDNNIKPETDLKMLWEDK